MQELESIEGRDLGTKSGTLESYMAIQPVT